MKLSHSGLLNMPGVVPMARSSKSSPLSERSFEARSTQVIRPAYPIHSSISRVRGNSLDSCIHAASKQMREFTIAALGEPAKKQVRQRKIV
jgi:hypothetical protein